jgi:hypothetical protein
VFLPASIIHKTKSLEISGEGIVYRLHQVPFILRHDFSLPDLGDRQPLIELSVYETSRKIRAIGCFGD